MAVALATPLTGARARLGSEPAVAVDGLVKRFDDRRVLDGVDLEVASGSVVALIGANGAGKSTLLRCLVGLARPDAGDVHVLGRDLTDLGPRALRSLRAETGFIFQRHHLVPRLSALSNVIHGALGRMADPRLWLQATAPSTYRAEAMACLARVGLEDHAGQRAERLSGGQSQRVAIARALMQRPKLLLADEPAASLDPQAGIEVMELFARIGRASLLTVIFTSHHLDHALRFADRIVALKAGRIVLDRPAAACAHADLAPLYAHD